MDKKKLWFKRKCYGWGWTPVSWEGWAVTLGYVFILLGLGLSLEGAESNSEIVFMFILPLALLTATLIRICYAKGEEPRWQWGKKPSEDTSDDQT